MPRRSVGSPRFLKWQYFFPVVCALGFLIEGASAQSDKGPPRVRHVYIPQDDLEALFGEGNKGALLTRSQFDELWEKAHGAPAIPPADAVLSQARYEAELFEDTLRVKGRLQLTKLERGWQEVELLLAGVAVESAKIDGRTAQLGRGEDGGLVWVLHDQGHHELAMEFSASLVRTGGDLTGTLQLPRVPSEFLLTLPPGKLVRVAGMELRPQGTEAGRNRFQVPIDRLGTLPIAILDETAAGQRVPLVFVRSFWKGAVEPAGLRWSADVTLDVAAQPANRFLLTLPLDVEVASLEAPELADWKVTEEDGHTELALAFRQPVQGRRIVRVAGLAPIPPDQPWQMPTLSVNGAVSQVGEIMLETAEALRQEVVEMHGVGRLATPTDLPVPAPATGAPPPGPRQANPRLRFAYWQEGFRLRLLASPREREVAAAVATLVDLDRAGLTLRSSITIEPRYAPLFEMAIELPAEWTINEVLVADQPVAWEIASVPVTTGQGSQLLRFELLRPLTPGNSLTVSVIAELHPSQWPTSDRSYASLDLPQVRVVGAGEVEGTLIIEATREMELQLDDLSQDLEPIPPPPGPASPDLGAVLAYHYQDDARVSGRIEARHKSAQVSVETVAFVQLGRDSSSTHYEVSVQIGGGELRTLDFLLPAAVGETIQVTPLEPSVRVIEQRHSPAAAQDSTDSTELNLWQIVFDRPVRDRLRVAISFEQPFSAGQQFELPSLAFPGVGRQTGYIAVEAAPDQEVEVESENLREVDPADLPRSTSYRVGRIVAAFEYPRLPYRLRLTGQHREAGEVLAAICDRATITSIVSDTGVVRNLAHYSLRSLGVQHLAVQLPVGSSLWSVTLDGEPIEVRRLGGQHILPLPAGGTDRSAGQHQVELLYETPLRPSGATSTGAEPAERTSGWIESVVRRTIRQLTPRVNMTVLQLSWKVHLPSGKVLVSSLGDFDSDVVPSRPSMVGWLREQIAENCVQEPIWKLGLLAGALALGGMVWLMAQSRGIYALGLTVAVLALVVTMVVPAVRSAREAARESAVGNNLRQIGMGMAPESRLADEQAPPPQAPQPKVVAESSPKDAIVTGAQADTLAGTVAREAKELAAGVAGGDQEAGKPAASRFRAAGAHPGGGVSELVDRPAPGKRAALVMPPPQVQAAQDLKASQAEARGLAKGGRLSLTMNLPNQVDEGYGFSGSEGAGELILEVQDQTRATTFQWLVTSAVVLLAWLTKNRPRSLRATLAAGCLLVPLGLSGLVPLAWTVVLDGLFVGGLAALLLWSLRTLATYVVQKIPILSRAGAARPTAVMTSLLILLFVCSAEAQSNSAQPKAETTPDSNRVQRNAADSTGRPVQELEPSPPGDSKPFSLYIPYDPENGDPRESRWVYLPYDTFRRLWGRAHPDKLLDPPPGVEAVVAEVGYEGRLDGSELARFDGRMVVHQFRDKWTRVPLPFGEVALHQVEVDGQPATVDEKWEAGPSQARGPRSGAAIYLEKSGMHVVDVHFSVPVIRLGATGSLTIPLLPIASGRLRFQLPDKQLDVKVDGSTGGYRRISQQENEVLSLPIGGVSALTIRWQPRRDERQAQQLFSADQVLLVDIQDSGVHLRSHWHYRVAQGATRTLEFQLPDEIAIRSVTGPDVADWSIRTAQEDVHRPGDEAIESGDRRLVVVLKSETRTGTDLQVDAYMLGRAPLGPISVKTPQPLAVTRETGRIVIGCSGQFHVRVAGTSGLAQIEREGIQVPGSNETSCDLLSAYRYTSRPWSLDLEISRTQPRLAVAARTAVAVTNERVTLQTSLEATITDAPLGTLRLRLPANLRLARVVVPGGDWFVSRNADHLAVRVELDQPIVGKLPIEIQGSLAGVPGTDTLHVPLVEVTASATQSGQIAIVLDPDLDAVLEDSGGATSLNPGDLSGILAVLAKSERLYAFQYQTLPQGLALRIRAAVSQMSADVASTVSVREGSLAYVFGLDLEFRGRSRSQFQFTTPDWLGADINVEGSGLREVRSEPGSEGRRIWTVTLQRPVRGKYQLRLVQTVPLPSDGRISAALVEPLGADPVRSFVILENRSAAELTEVEVSGASPLQLSDVPLALADELRRRAISAHRVSGPTSRLAWQRQEREQERAIAAQINLADLLTVISSDGTYRTQAAYVIMNRTQQFLELELPARSRLWAAYVAGQPVRPATVQRAGKEVTLIPLQKISVGDLFAQVVLVYSGDLPGKLGIWTKVVPPAPEILGNVPVARTIWTVYTPNDYSTGLIAKESNMTRVAAGDVVVARNLAFFEEMNELVKVARFSSSLNANRLAINNLRQLGGAIQSSRSAPVSTPRVEADPGNVQSWRYTTDKSAATTQLQLFYHPPEIGKIQGGDNWNIVQQRAQELQSEIAGVTGDQPKAVGKAEDAFQLDAYYLKTQVQEPGVQLLLKLEGAGSVHMGEAGGPRGGAVPEATEKEQRRGKLRLQNEAMIGKLKEDQTRASLAQSVLQSSQPAPQQTSVLSLAAKDDQGKPGMTDATTRAGAQSIEISIPRLGQPQHFVKLLGDPKLSLSVRDQDLTRWFGGGSWAVLCVFAAGTVITLTSRTQALRWLGLHWPWLVVVIGAAWLFLLPVGLGGAILAAVGLAVLAWRTRPHRRLV